MKLVSPSAAELASVRADPLVWEQELDVRPEVAEALERATGIRAGRVYWRSAHEHLYGLELADLGRGRPSMATVYGHWDRYEPRPPEHEIDADLVDFSLWLADIAPGIDPADVSRVVQFARVPTTWPADAVRRTPEERFAHLPGFPHTPHYLDVEGLRMAYVEAGAGDPVLMLHGEPTWGYLYRHMIPGLASAGRVVVPDLIGFGRSDKPLAVNAYSYRAHVRWLRRFITGLDLQRITLVVHDWGGLLGLRALAQMPERFARVVAMNTLLPDGGPLTDAFLRWRRFCQQVEHLDVPRLLRGTLKLRALTDAEATAYAAPFPSREFETGALVFPRLVPIREDHPGARENREAIARLRALDIPVLLPWGDADPITTPGEPQLRAIFRHVAPPLPIRGAGHFLPEEAGEEVAAHIATWMRTV